MGIRRDRFRYGRLLWGFRQGANLFANCVLALDATTGKLIWHYQTVHHDLFDFDNPPAPILITLRPPGGPAQDVVVQLTKMGYTCLYWIAIPEYPCFQCGNRGASIERSR